MGNNAIPDEPFGGVGPARGARPQPSGRRAKLAAVVSAATVLAVSAGFVTATGAQAASPTVTFAETSSWSGGYVGQYTITNTSSAALSTWTLVFSLPSGESVTSLWNGTEAVSGQTYTVTPVSWNASVAVGASIDIGFQVSGSGQPSTCSFDNVSCTVGGGSSPTASPTPTAPQGGGTMGGFSPYTDMSLYPQFNLVSGAAAEGTKFFNLAFITDGGTCNPEWGGVTAINDSTTLSNVAALEAEGGNVRVSFGGEDGNEIAQDCTSVSSLVSAYQSVISEYKLTYIDFDIEGAAITDTSANNLRNQAIAQLEKNDPGLQVSYTLPVLPTGLTSAGVAVLQSAETYGASIAAVNVMAMDYGSSFPGDMATLAEESVTATAAQVRTVWTSLSSAQALAKMAVTPMIGVNDAGTSETFTLADATTLANWAKANGLAWTSFWSATRDSECSGGAQSYAADDCSSVVQTAGEFGKEFSAIYY
jgi:Cellulose binding domain/Glycosyl hydrolases family 18